MSGSFAKTTTDSLSLAGTTLALSVDGTWTDGTICMQHDTAARTLTHALDVAATADNLQLCSGTAGSFRVAPTGAFNVAGGTRTININFDNDGLVDIAGGSLSWGGSAPDTDAGHSPPSLLCRSSPRHLIPMSPNPA